MHSADLLTNTDIGIDIDTDIDIDYEEIGEKYQCINCSTKFREIGKKVRCPTCDSSQVKKDLDYDNFYSFPKQKKW